jgi:hypothetical protein
MKALPKRLCINIGGFFGPCYEVTLRKGRLTYTYLSSRDSCFQELEELSPELRQLLGLKPLPQPEQIQPSAKQWQNFWRTLNRLNLWCWQGNYSDSAVCDGTGWSAEITYSDRIGGPHRYTLMGVLVILAPWVWLSIWPAYLVNPNSWLSLITLSVISFSSLVFAFSNPDWLHGSPYFIILAASVMVWLVRTWKMESRF